MRSRFDLLVRRRAKRNWFTAAALLLIFVAVFSWRSLSAATPPAHESRSLFYNSVAPLPSAAIPTIRSLRAENLGETMEFEVPLRMREFPKFLDRVGRGERIPRAELERDFLPLEKDYQKVRAWLISEGFTITETSDNRLNIFARGTVAQIQRSLQVEMVKATVRGVEYNTARSHPSLPVSVAAPILGVNGLQPFLRARNHLIHPNPDIGNKPPYQVKEILGAYDAANLGLTGSGQTIAILIDAVPKASDLKSFWNANGISASINNLQEVNVTGSEPTDTEGEATLDVEWSSGVAPGAIIRLYATGTLAFTNIDKGLERIISDLQNQVQIGTLSISLGLGENFLAGSSEVQTESQYFATITNSGVSVFVASGDGGSNPDENGNYDPAGGNTLQVEYEASDPSVTGVGGTNLTLTSNGAVSSETGWSGSGGGISEDFSRPTWQTGLGVPSGSKRLVPDVSLVASNTTYAYFFFEGAAGGVAGTSWATPTWAGFSALINQARANNALSPLGAFNPHIYPLISTNNFRDVTSGSNGQYSCGIGYDMVTGIGVPDVGVLLGTLAGTGGAAPSVGTFSPTIGPPGTLVTISGSSLSRATSVEFNGLAATSFTVVAANEITATVPSGATSGVITVVTPSGSAASVNSFTVTAATPANDNFANARVITGNSGTVTGTNVGGTKESGEPSIAGNSGGSSVWYSWNAPQTAIYTFNTYGSSFDTLLAVYTGTSVGSLASVAADDDSGTGVTSAVSFSAVAGTTYMITVDGNNDQTGAIVLNWLENTVPSINNFVPSSGAPGLTVVINGAEFTGATAVAFAGVPASFTVVSPTQISATTPAGAVTGVVTISTPAGTATSAGVFTVFSPPPNDDFAAAQALSGPSGTATGANVGATKEPGEPNHGGNAGGHSVWYSWTAPANSNVTFNTFGSSFDTLLAAYTGSAVDSLTSVASDENAGTGFTSAIAFAAVQGTTYYIAVDGANGVVGNIVLNWSSNVTAPVISSFTPLSGAAGTAVTIFGSALSSVTAVNFDGVAANYLIDSDTQITASVPSGAATGPISVTNISGTGASSADFTVSAAPPNDDFANAFTFSGTGAVIASNVGATKEPGEPNHAGSVGGASVWWNWTAPTTGDYTISTIGSSFDTLLAVYTGSSVSTLAGVASNDDSPFGGTASLLVLHAVAGTVYHLAVDGLNGATGQIVLSIAVSDSGILFSTGFEASEGYVTTSLLSGQNGWLNQGSGLTGIVKNFFSTGGQQAFIGSRAPRSSAETFVWQPIDYPPKAGEVITFQVNMQITASTNGRYDEFGWAAYNTEGDSLFAIIFDNNALEVDYALNDNQGAQDAGVSFDRQTIYTLAVTMDFANNVWSATLNGTPIANGLKISKASGIPLNLGDVDAFWWLENFGAGNNAMVFDNYSVTFADTTAPSILLQPQPQTVTAGSNVVFSVAASGTQPMTYQWRKNHTAISGATSADLALANVQAADAGSYDVIVGNNGGSVTSGVAQLTVTIPQAPNLTPYQQTGWSDRVVVTNASGSTVDDLQISSTDNLYVDWAVINNGLAAVPAGFQTQLFIDGVLRNTWTQQTALEPNTFTDIVGFPIGSLDAGAHTVEIVADSADSVAEYNEADNSYTKNITVGNQANFSTIATSVAPPPGGSVAGGGTFKDGTLIALTAAANTGYKFVDWTDQHGVVSTTSSFELKVAESRNLVANFVSTTSGANPAITISVPTTSGSYATMRSWVNLEGTASSGAGIKDVTWSNAGGGSGKAAGTTRWLVTGIPLHSGVNRLTVTLHDSNGQIATSTVDVTSAAASTFTGSYRGLLVLPGATPSYVGLGHFTVTSTGAFSGSIWYFGARHPVAGVFNPQAFYSGVLAGSDSKPVKASLELSAGVNPDIAGTVVINGVSANVVAERAGFSRANPWLAPGRYTIAVEPNPDDSNAPAGNGFAAVQINPSGDVIFTGRLADGAPFSGASALPQSSVWPLYVSLYRATGDLAGPVSFQATVSPVLSGVADWHKLANAPDARYSAAIQSRALIVGNHFKAQSGNTSSLASGPRQVTLAAGGLPSTILDTASIAEPNHFNFTNVNSDSIVLSFDAITGVLRGSFIDPGTGKSVGIHGVLLQDDDIGVGYFLGPNESGSIEIAAPQ